MSLNLNKMVTDLARQAYGTSGSKSEGPKQTGQARLAASSDKAAMSINSKNLSQGVDAAKAVEGGSKGRLLNTTDASQDAANVKNAAGTTRGTQALGDTSATQMLSKPMGRVQIQGEGASAQPDTPQLLKNG